MASEAAMRAVQEILQLPGLTEGTDRDIEAADIIDRHMAPQIESSCKCRLDWTDGTGTCQVCGLERNGT